MDGFQSFVTILLMGLLIVIKFIRETEKTEIPIQNYEEGLNYAIDDLKANWREYRRRYEEWLEN